MSKEEKPTGLEVDSTLYETRFTAKYLKRKPYTKKDPSKITAFIPGLIKDIFVYDGKLVNEGDKLLILEAMKMENIVTSPVTGKIKKIHVRKGEKVTKDQSIIDIDTI